MNQLQLVHKLVPMEPMLILEPEFAEFAMGAIPAQAEPNVRHVQTDSSCKGMTVSTIAM